MAPIPGIGKISGVLISTDLESGRETHEPTIECCHCGCHWVPRKGSGKRRGICLNCHGFTCGRPECDPCVPFEQRLENIEQGRPLDHRPIMATGGYEASPGGILIPKE